MTIFPSSSTEARAFGGIRVVEEYSVTTAGDDNVIPGRNSSREKIEVFSALSANTTVAIEVALAGIRFLNLVRLF